MAALPPQKKNCQSWRRKKNLFCARPAPLPPTMVTMPWANEAAPLKGSADRFPPATKFNDWVFMLLMLANLLAVGMIAATDLPALKDGSQQQQGLEVPASVTVGFAIALFPSLITGVATISFFLFLMHKVDAEIMFKTTFGLTLGMLILLLGLFAAVAGLPVVMAGPLSLPPPTLRTLPCTCTGSLPNC